MGIRVSANDRKFVRNLNNQFVLDIEKILEKEGKISRFPDFLKFIGVNEEVTELLSFNDIKENEICNLEKVLESVFNLQTDYPEEIKKIYTSNSRNNPYRIEFTLKNNNPIHSEETLLYAFGNWIQVPIWAHFVLRSRDAPSFLYGHVLKDPKYIQFVFRPEKIQKAKEDYLSLHRNNNPLDKRSKYSPISVRIANDFDFNQNGGSITVSNIPSKEPGHHSNKFDSYGSDPRKLLKKWDFLIPGLKQYSDFLYRS